MAAACVKEVDRAENDTVMMSVSSKGIVNSDGVTVSTVRIMALDLNSGTFAYNGTYQGDADLRFVVPKGRYRLYVVINEFGDLATGLANATRLSDLESLTLTSPTTEADLVCFGETKDFMLQAKASSTGSPREGEVSFDNGSTWSSAPLTVSATRVATKVTVYARRKTVSTSTDVKLTKVTLSQLPTLSYLADKAHETNQPTTSSVVVYNNSNPVTLKYNDESLAIGTDEADFLRQNEGKFDLLATVIFTEKNFSDAALYPSLITLEGRYAGESATWQSDKFGENPLVEPANYNLRRGKHYNIFCTISSNDKILIDQVTLNDWKLVLKPLN